MSGSPTPHEETTANRPDVAARKPAPPTGLAPIDRAGRALRRGLIGVVGSGVVIVGLVLVPLPGPGWLIVFVGLGILATEFEWAERLLHRVRERLHLWTEWMQRQPLIARLAAGAIGMLVLAGILFVALMTYGALPEPLRR